MEERMISNLKKHPGLTSGLFLAFVVLICFVLTFVFEGVGIKDLAISSAENDELIYYYEVAGVINYGIPQGFFGYYEVSARALSFGPWSPLLIINYCILGKLFGWSLIKAVFYNAFMLMLSVFLFGLLARPGKYQTVFCAIALSSYTFLMYGVFSVVPEVTCYSYSIIYMGLCYSSLRENKRYKTVLMFALAFLLTLMRPYYAGLMIPALYFWYKRRGKAVIIPGALLTAASLYGYFFIAVNLCAWSPVGGFAERLIPKLELNKDNIYFLCSKVTVALLAGGGDMIRRLVHGLYATYEQLVVFFVDEVWARNFFTFYYIFILLVLLVILTWKKRSSGGKLTDSFLWRCFWPAYYTLMTLAVALYFSGWSADRHLAEFVVMGILFTAMETGESGSRKWVFALLELGLIYALTKVPNREREYVSREYINEIYEEKEELEKIMPLTYTGEPSWDNTVFWMYEDRVDGESVIIPWRALYAVPDGYAFNMTLGDEWFDHLEEKNAKMRSKYFATVPSGDGEEWCIKNGGRKIAEYGGIVLYRLH